MLLLSRIETQILTQILTQIVTHLLFHSEVEEYHQASLLFFSFRNSDQKGRWLCLLLCRKNKPNYLDFLKMILKARTHTVKLLKV